MYTSIFSHIMYLYTSHTFNIWYTQYLCVFVHQISSIFLGSIVEIMCVFLSPDEYFVKLKCETSRLHPASTLHLVQLGM